MNTFMSKNYAFPFIPRIGACLLLAICNRRVLFHIAPLRYLHMHDVFGQCHLTTKTCCKVWTHKTHCGSTRYVPRRVPRPCPCTTSVMQSRTEHNIYQQSHMQQSPRHRKHTAAPQGTYQGACLVHAHAQQV